MFRSLIQETSAPNLGRHRSLIEALFGVKNDHSNETFDTDEDVEWTWDNAPETDFVVLLNNNRDVKFHRNISSGTAVVRGTQPMSNDQYFWEVKMISPVYGTDMMVGVGTSEADMSQVHDKFFSLLGNDNKTWGLSYTGLFHHNGEARDYGTRFGQGSIIGVHLDMWNGTLSFYKNKKHLGIASRGLKGKTLYAMASSTAACSSMRILRSCSFPSSLQYLCCNKLREIIPDEKDVLKEITLPPGLHAFLENNLGWLLSSRYTETVVHQCMPSPKRRGHWAFGLDSVSEMWLDDSEDSAPSGSSSNINRGETNVVLVGNRPFVLCTCTGIRNSSSSSTTSTESSASAVNADSNCSCASNEKSPRQVTPHEPGGCSSLDERRRTETEQDQSIEMDDVLEDSGNPVESEAKRRRCSYNYAMGLSDPDSE
ncbi:unnamed protein product [Larinioides sclopetarius]|uniref:SPRY domain-containing SOCS box protein 3 n=1 Tax=Larinioides sclopetarius TaxID=280406 RepID=A0AAV2A7H5_9ARAC